MTEWHFEELIMTGKKYNCPMVVCTAVCSQIKALESVPRNRSSGYKGDALALSEIESIAFSKNTSDSVKSLQALLWRTVAALVGGLLFVYWIIIIIRLYLVRA